MFHINWQIPVFKINLSYPQFLVQDFMWLFFLDGNENIISHRINRLKFNIIKWLKKEKFFIYRDINNNI